MPMRPRPHLGLEAGVQGGEEGGLASQGQDLLLVEGALHIVLLDHKVLLEALEGKHLTCGLELCQEHLGR